MASRCADVSYFAVCSLIIFCCFCIQKPRFLQNDGISITMNKSGLFTGINESHLISSIFVYNQRKHVIYVRSTSLKNIVLMLILLCGDVETCPGPWSYNQNDFTIGHQNIRGLWGKKDLLSEFLHDKNIKIFGVTESLLKSSIPSVMCKIRGYSFQRRDRGKNGGGVGVYIKDGIDYLRRPDLEHLETECIWLEILQKKSKSFLIGILYRPPDSSKHLHKNFLQTLSNVLSTISNSNKEIIIIGDINANYLNNKDHKPLKELFQINGFHQTIKGATRITKDSETLIDVIFTNTRNNLTKSEVVTSSLSDHDLIMCKRKINNTKFSAKTIRCRDYSNYDVTIIRNELSLENWEDVFDAKEPNVAWNSLESKLTEVINRHAPNVTKRVKGNSSPWLTREIKSEMNRSDALRRKFQKSKCNLDHENYKTQRNRVNNIIRRAQRNHHRQLLKDTERNPEKFWRALKNIFPTKDKSSCSKSFQIGDKLISDKLEIASRFCSFFTGIARELKLKSIIFTDFIWKPPNLVVSKTRLKFKLNPVTVNEVFLLLKKLQKNKSAGPDNLPPGFLKNIALHIAAPLTHVINTSIEAGIVPQGFKTGKVIPVYKSGPKNIMDNYRPITILPVCSKIYEKCIYKQLILYLESNNLLSTRQFGFRAGRNTELAVTLFVDEIHKNMNESKLTGAVFIDLSKAFDTLSHSQILASLKSLEFRNRNTTFSPTTCSTAARLSLLMVLAANTKVLPVEYLKALFSDPYFS